MKFGWRSTWTFTERPSLVDISLNGKWLVSGSLWEKAISAHMGTSPASISYCGWHYLATSRG